MEDRIARDHRVIKRVDLPFSRPILGPGMNASPSKSLNSTSSWDVPWLAISLSAGLNKGVYRNRGESNWGPG